MARSWLDFWCMHQYSINVQIFGAVRLLRSLCVCGCGHENISFCLIWCVFEQEQFQMAWECELFVVIVSPPRASVSTMGLFFRLERNMRRRKSVSVWCQWKCLDIFSLECLPSFCESYTWSAKYHIYLLWFFFSRSQVSKHTHIHTAGQQHTRGSNSQKRWYMYREFISYS